MTIIDDFKARFPEFLDAEVDANLPKLIIVWPCYYGGTYTETCDQEIILNLLAHLLVTEINPTKQPFQTAASQSVGDVSVSYVDTGTPGDPRDFFKFTKYGQRFKQLTSFRSGGIFA